MHSHSVALILRRLALDETKPVDARLKTILQSACELLDLDVAIVSQINHTEKTYTIAHAFDKSNTVPVGKIFALGVNFCTLVLRRNAPVGIHSMALIPHFRHPCHEHMPIEAYMGAPITVNGQTFGTLSVCGGTKHPPFTDSDHWLMLHLASLVSTLMAEKAHDHTQSDSTRETTTAPIVPAYS